MIQTSRRAFLSASLYAALPTALLACSETRHGAPAASSPEPRLVGLAPSSAAPPTLVSAATEHEICLLTDRNIEGPYYRPGAPEQSSLATAGMGGQLLLLSGTVLSEDCKSPLGNVQLDIWQADSDGRYDNDGSFGPGATAMRLRGRLRTDAQGRYAVKTIVPGRYLNGRTYRPAHLHVKLAASNHASLTTQLYFPEDPFNEGDPFIRPSLIMQTEGSFEGLRAQYDFVVAVA